MKIINYNYGYNNTFNCSIHGRIIVTRWEWRRIVNYLFHSRVKIFDYDSDKSILKQDLERNIETKKGKLFNIRVTATELAVKKFGFGHDGRRYKTGNYAFLVLKERE